MSWRPSLNYYFPDPFSGQWPDSHSPVLCQCQKLYALVALCCCVPGAHLLVCHSGVSKRANMLNSMPKGPRYFDYVISERTSVEEFSSFLLRAEASATTSGTRPLSRMSNEDADRDREGSPTFAVSSRSNTPVNLAASGMGAELARNKGQRALYMVVVCIHGITSAHPDVLSALVDALTFGVVRSGSAVRPIPAVRVVAFCEAVDCAATLPMYVRNAFALSTFVSSLAMDSAAVIQSPDPQSSHIVNKRCMLEVGLASDGSELVDSVRLSGHVARYLRHLVMVVRSSTLMNRAPACHLPSRYPQLVKLVKAAALLFYSDVAYPLIPANEDEGIGSVSTRQFRRVVVSPSDVACLFPCMTAHLFTVQYNMLPAALSIDRLEGGSTGSISGEATRGSFSLRNGSRLERSRMRSANASLSASHVIPTILDEDMATWDARAAQLIPIAGSGRRTTRTMLDRTGVLGDDTLGGSMRSLRGMLDTLVEGTRSSETLTYEQTRELIRITLVECSSPPPG